MAASQARVGDVAGYLEARGIESATASEFRLGKTADDVPVYGGRLCIPYLGVSGVYGIRFRCLDPHHEPTWRGEDTSCPKYLGVVGAPTRMFNTRALHAAKGSINVTEGELDAVILAQMGLHAVGIAGVSTWKPYHARVLAGFSAVGVWGDGDKPGRDFAATIADEIGSAAWVVRVPDGDDVGSIYMRGGAGLVRDIARGN